MTAGSSRGIYTQRWATLQQKISAALPTEDKHLVLELDDEFRAILRNRNEKIKEYMVRCGELPSSSPSEPS